MGLNMTLDQSETQAESVKSVVKVQSEGYQALQEAIQNFTNDTESLKGEAYDNARSYYLEVLLPLAKGGKLYAEALGEASAKLPTNYQSEVDTKSWSEEQLQQLIQQEENAIFQLNPIRQSLNLLDRVTQPNYGTQQNTILQQNNILRQNTDSLISTHTAARDFYATILTKLQTYNTSSKSLFDDLENIELQMSTGLTQSQNSWNAESGTFTIPEDLKWASYLSAYEATKDLKANKEDKQFINNMMAEYGFDVTTAQQLLTIKKGIDAKFPNSSQKEKDYFFLRVIGAASYEDDDFDRNMWNLTAGNFRLFFSLKFHDMNYQSKSLLDVFQDLGLSKQEAKELNYNLRLQHEMAGGGYNPAKQTLDDTPALYDSFKNSYKKVYGTTKGFNNFWDSKLKAYSNHGKGNPDFTHQSITMATHLNPSPAQLSDVYGGREHVKDLAGWEGDTTRNANDRDPSIGEDDYKADLDSVNIIGRMKKGQSYVEAMSAYYHDVNQGESVREKEFLKNKDWKQVKNTIYDSLVPNETYREIMTPYYKDLFQKNSIQDRDFIKNEEWKYAKNAVYDDILPEDIKRKRAEAAKNYILKEFPVQGKNILKFLERLEAVAEK